MNLTLHLIRKDLRHFRLAALFWAVVVVSQIFLTNRLLGAMDNNWRNTASSFVVLVYFIGMVVAYLLGGMIVLADAPAGSVSLWKTRPISGGRLLTAKGVTIIVLIGFLPVALWLPWWLYCGFAAGDLALTALNIFFVALNPALLGATLAAVVDQAGRFLMLTMIFVAAIILCFITALVPRPVPPGLLATRVLLDVGCVVLTALLAIITQYRTRQVTKSGSVLVAGLAAFLVVWNFWPVDYSSVWTESRLALPGAEKISGRIWGAQIESRTNPEGQSEPYILIRAGFAGVPEDVFVSDGVADVELSWADGTKVRREKLLVQEFDRANRGQALRLALGFGPETNPLPQHWDAETQVKFQADKAEMDRRRREKSLGGKTIRQPVPAGLTDSLRLEFPVSPALALKARATPPVCRITARLNTKRPVILGEVSLKEDATIVRNGRLRVVKLERSKYEQKRVGLLDVRYVGTLTLIKPSYSGERAFYLIDRKHETLGWWLSYGSVQNTPPLAGTLKWYPIDFTPPSLWREGRWVEMPDWQKTLTLVEEESQSAGSFTSSLGVESLKISEPEPANQ